MRCLVLGQECSVGHPLDCIGEAGQGLRDPHDAERYAGVTRRTFSSGITFASPLPSFLN